MPYADYDRRTNRKMAEHNRSGGAVRSPVRKVKGASKGDKWDRAKFNSRKAAQVLSRKDPLVDDKGQPTPAAMQFKRWGEKIPKTYEDVRGIQARANRQKETYRPDAAFTLGYMDVMANRFDQRGQGVPCGSSWISRSKKCSKDKSRQTSKEARQRGAEKSRDLLKLKQQIKASKGQRPRVKAQGEKPPVPVRSKGAEYFNQRIKGTWKESHDGVKAIAFAFDHDMEIDTHAYVGKGKIQRINPPSKKYPHGSVTVKSSRPDGGTDKFDMIILADQIRSSGNSLSGRNREKGNQEFKQSRLGKLSANFPSSTSGLKEVVSLPSKQDFLKATRKPTSGDIEDNSGRLLGGKYKVGDDEFKIEPVSRPGMSTPDGFRLIVNGEYVNGPRSKNRRGNAYHSSVKRAREAAHEKLRQQSRSDAFHQGYLAVMRGDAEDDPQELAKLIMSALEDGYTSGIEALLSYAIDGDTIYGRFRDEGKTFGYTLKGDEISYWQLQGQPRTDSLLDEPVYRADRMKGTKGKKCNIGTKCRYGCISSKKVCRLQPSPAAKGIIRKALDLIKRVLSKSKSEADKAVLSEAKQVAKEAKQVTNQAQASRDRATNSEQQANNIAQLRKMRRKDSDPWLQGYLDVMQNRFDQRGQGVPCGGGWISRSKKCSKEKAKQTSKEAKARGAEKARDRLKLKQEIKRSGRIRDLKKSVGDRFQELQSGKIPVEQRSRVRDIQGREVSELQKLTLTQNVERSKRKAAKEREKAPKVDLPTATVVAISKPRESMFGDDPMHGVKFRMADGREEWKNFSSRDAAFQKLKRGQSYSVSTDRNTGKISNVFDPVETPKEKPKPKAKDSPEEIAATFDKMKTFADDTFNRDVLNLTAQGLSPRQIATNLQVGQGTVTARIAAANEILGNSRDPSSTNLSRSMKEFREKRLAAQRQNRPQQSPPLGKASPPQQVADLNRQGIKVKAAPHMLTRQEYISAFPGTKKAIADTFGNDLEIDRFGDGQYRIDWPGRRKGQPMATGNNLREAAYKYAVASGKAPDHFTAVRAAAESGDFNAAKRALETDYPDVLSSLRSQQIENAPMQQRKQPTMIGAISIDSAQSEAWQRGYNAVMNGEVA